MSFKEIQDLIKLMDKSSLSEFYYKNDQYEIKIKGQRLGEGMPVYTAPSVVPAAVSSPVVSIPQQPAVAEAPAKTEAPKEAASGTKYVEVRSPMVGTFYRSPGPDKPVFVSVGDSIQKGSVVCIIEAMKLFNEIESEVSGKIVKVMVDDASPVEYDQVLFLVEP